MKDVSLVLYSGSANAPVVDIFEEDTFREVDLVMLRKGFWVIELKMPGVDQNVVVHVTPVHGSSERYVVTFKEQQTFAFVDIAKQEGLVPFGEFLAFFNHAIQNRKIHFSFNSEDQLADIRQFLLSFPKEYVMWGLIYICNQPWFSLFQFDERLSELVKQLVDGFILSNFFSEKDDERERETLKFEYVACAEAVRCTKRKPEIRQMYESAVNHLVSLFCVVERQLGIGYSLILSVIFDVDDSFPRLANLPALSGGDASAFSLLNRLFEMAKCQEEKVRVSLVGLMLLPPELPFPYFETLKLANLEDIAEVIHERMLFSRSPSVEPLKTILGSIPSLTETMTALLAIPFEWLTTVREVAGLNDEQFSEAAKASIEIGVPKHLEGCFANVSEDGALFFGDVVQDHNVVVQPGSIIQDNVKFGVHSMLMSGSIALSGSELNANCFAPRNGVVLPLTETKPISPKASIELPVNIELGVSIADDVVVSRNARIGAGSVLQQGSFVSKSSSIGKACIIAADEHVNSEIRVPKGFTFSWDQIEFADEIPKVVYERSGRFQKQKSGFVEMKAVLDVIPELLVTYLTKMRSYPRVCGKEIGLNCEHEKWPEITEECLFSIFGPTGLGVCIEYWKVRTGVCEKLDHVIASLCNHIIRDLEGFFEEVSFEAMAPYVLYICKNLALLVEKGVDSAEVDKIKKFIFEMADENVVRYGLVNSLEAKHSCKLMMQIINLVHQPVVA